MSISDRIWLEYEQRADRFPDELTGPASEDPLIREQNATRADLAFRGSGSHIGPAVPQMQASDDRVAAAKRWQAERMRRLADERRNSDASLFSQALHDRVCCLSCDAKRAAAEDYDWIQREIEDAIRLERRSARLEIDEETLAEVLELIGVTR